MARMEPASARALRAPPVDQALCVRFVAGDCARLPFPDAAFDVVVSFETIEHVSEPERLLDVFQTLLADDGVLDVIVLRPRRVAVRPA